MLTSSSFSESLPKLNSRFTNLVCKGSLRVHGKKRSSRHIPMQGLKLNRSILSHVCIVPDPFELRSIWTLDWHELRKLIMFPEIDIDDDKWILPPHLINKSQSRRTLDFSKVGQSLNDESQKVANRRRLKRLALIYGLVVLADVEIPVTLRRRQRFARHALSLSSWRSNFESILKLANDCLNDNSNLRFSDSCPDGQTIFSSVERGKFQDFITNGYATMVNTYGRFDDLYLSGYFDDWISNVSVPKRQRSVNTNKHQPFTDEDLTRILDTSIKLSQVSVEGARLFSQYRNEFSVKLGEPEHAARTKLWKTLAERLSAAIDPIKLTDYIDGNDDLHLFDSNDRSRIPRYIGAIVRASESSNAAILAFSTGLRPDELNNLKKDCVRYTRLGYCLRGLVVKGDTTGHGIPRDWPLPALAVNAIKNQIKIIDLISPNAESLWIDSLKMNSKTDNFITVSVRFNQFYHKLQDSGGVSLEDIRPINIYRLRTSAARIVALSIRGGTKAASTVLGHSSIIETIGYYKARGDFDQEFAETVKEVQAAFGREIVESCKNSLTPRKLQELVSPIFAATAEQEGESVKDGPRELGEENTFDAFLAVGGAFRLVRKGVLCSAINSSLGKCAQARGRIDISKCQTDCSLRYETASFVEDRRDAISWALDNWSSIDRREVVLRKNLIDTLFEAICGYDGYINSSIEDVRIQTVSQDLDESDMAMASSRSIAVIEVLRGR